MDIKSSLGAGDNDAISEARDRRREQRIAELYANDRQFRSAGLLPGNAEKLAHEIAERLTQEGRLAPLLRALMVMYESRPALGQRTREPVIDPDTGRTATRLLPCFETITYGEVWNRVSAIAAAWHQDPASPVKAGDFVATVGFASPEYVMVDLACNYLGLVSVPLQHNAPTSQIAPIIDEIGPRVLAASVEHIEMAVESALGSESLRHVVIFDYRPEFDGQRHEFESARNRLEGAGMTVRVETLPSLIERGQNLPAAPLYTEGSDDQLAMVLYTSGSTGAPKGAMYTERMLVQMWTASVLRADTPVINVNFMPLNHLTGRSSIIFALIVGGTSYFVAESDLSTLFEDLALVRPTHINLVPRVVEMLYQHYRRALGRGLAAGLASSEAQTRAISELRNQVLGGRVLGGLVGSAPLSAEMAMFLDSCLDVHIFNGYGLTEVGLLTRDNVVIRPPVIDYKLVDVPELGYFLTDKPFPRGELLVKSENATRGYYKRPQLTASVFDGDGFYRTGDVMAEIAPDRLVYLDRRNNVIKLSQGEFVALARLEAIYSSAPWVRQIFVYGNSERAHLLAVIVPTAEACERFADDPDGLKDALAASLQQTARAAELQSYELPIDFLVENEPFSDVNGLLSGVGKLLRPKLQARYGTLLEALYADIAAARADEIQSLRATADQVPVIDTVIRAATAVLGFGRIEPHFHFTELGGDSLSALTFSDLLHELFGVQVPVGIIVSPAANLGDLADHIVAERTAHGKRPTFATVHAEDATEIRASELTLDKFIDRAVLAAAPGLHHITGSVRVVLLTGANGWLGRFLTLEWLQRLADVDGKLITIVRGRDAAHARARLVDSFSGFDGQLSERFQDLSAKHLVVLSGDIGEPNLGLNAATWERLTKDVDLIVHNAALVNHLLPYSQLFGPNVVGTAELIRLALTTTIKPITYLSTMAVAMGVEADDFTEDGDIRAVNPVRTVDDSYANGYANSKWAGEVLLREAYDLAGLPVSVFRSDRMLAHTRYSGQLNMPDMFTRLVLSMLVTGIAPGSFYTGDAEQRARAHYDGLPVDFVAEAITTIGAESISGFNSFDVMNPYDDGISLDTFVDWLISAGHHITRIDDYGQWLSRFETALKALPERLRRLSVLPLLEAYAEPLQPVSGVDAPTAIFHAAVRSAKVGPDKDIPHLTSDLICKHAKDLQLRGLLL